MNNAAQKYLQTQVTTTTSADVLILLYDGAIKFLKRAKIKIQEGDVKEKGVLIAKALDIINELQCSLNKEKGGQLAENLNNLYFYCNAQLLMANLKMDVAVVDKVVGILGELRSAFVEAKSMTPGGETQSPGRTSAAPARQPMPNPANPAMPNMASPGRREGPQPVQSMQGAQPQAAPTYMRQAQKENAPQQPQQGGASQPAPPTTQPPTQPAVQPAAQASQSSQSSQSGQPGQPGQPAEQQRPKPAPVRNIRSQRGMAAYMNS